MDLNKHLSFFNPYELIKEEINIIGAGAVGSWLALQLAKLGIEKLVIWDYDTVDEHNITNQVYNITDVGKLKVEALEQHLKRQNPEIKITKMKKYTNQPLKGIVCLCVDSAELRHKIAENQKYNIQLKFLLDGRIGLETSQVYAVNWRIPDQVDTYLDITDYKDNEVVVPVSPCGTTLSVSPSVQICVSVMTACLINYTKQKKTKIMYNIDAFKPIIV